MKAIFVLFLLCGAIGNAVAKDKADTHERHVRFLAVGEAPPFRQEIREGVRYELEPPAGSIPPREVVCGFEGDDTNTVKIRLGQISGALKVPPGKGPLILRQVGENGKSTPWLQFACPESGDFLVLLWRASPQATWAGVKSLVLPDNLTAAPASGVRVINLAPVDVGVVIGDEKLLLGAGRMIQRQLPEKSERVFEVKSDDDKGNLQRVYAGVISQNPGERGLVIVYRADGLTPRRPVKVSVLREPAPVPPPDPEEKK